jgi:hypothetical protein
MRGLCRWDTPTPLCTPPQPARPRPALTRPLLCWQAPTPKMRFETTADHGAAAKYARRRRTRSPRIPFPLAMLGGVFVGAVSYVWNRKPVVYQVPSLQLSSLHVAVLLGCRLCHLAHWSAAMVLLSSRASLAGTWLSDSSWCVSHCNWHIDCLQCSICTTVHPDTHVRPPTPSLVSLALLLLPSSCSLVVLPVRLRLRHSVAPDQAPPAADARR